MRIGDHHLGGSRRPYIIAEIGVNHDGCAARARELISSAAGAGADAVKFQYFTAERLLSRAARLAEYQREAGANDAFSMLAKLQLSVRELADLAKFAGTLRLDPIVTVFSLEHVREMQSLPWATYKIASPDIVNRPLIEALGDHGKPLILSTGASTAQEIRQAASWIKGHEFALMQCVSAYPTPNSAAHLSAIATLRDMVNVPVGYSDHTTDEHTGGLAISAGAAFLEKHLTYDRAARGPDHAMSLDPKQFERYITFARLAGEMLGNSRKIVHEIEKDVRQVSRQSIVAARRLRAGETMRSEDLTVKRPGSGMAPWRLEELVGRRVAVDIEPDTAITEAHLSAESRESRGNPAIQPADAA